MSVPDQYFEITRPKEIEVTGRDLDGNEVSFEADELLARLVQHELDHLDGVLFIDRVGEATRTRLAGALNRLKRKTEDNLNGH